MLITRWHSASAQFDRLLVRQQEEFTQPTEHDLEVWSRPLRTFANDYSLWDEMVDYIATPSAEWAENNITVSLETFEVNGAWVFRTDGSLIFGVDSLHPDQPVPSELAPRQVVSLFDWQLFPHCFVACGGEVLELCGAPIQPTSDTHRRSKPLDTWSSDATARPRRFASSPPRSLRDVVFGFAQDQEESGLLARGREPELHRPDRPRGSLVGRLRLRSAVPRLIEAKRSLDISLFVHTLLALVLLGVPAQCMNALVLRLPASRQGLEDGGGGRARSPRAIERRAWTAGAAHPLLRRATRAGANSSTSAHRNRLLQPRARRRTAPIAPRASSSPTSATRSAPR
ncbi:MAG: CHASE4 domain-containing protein [Candidatus Eisenbacteria bacterium]